MPKQERCRFAPTVGPAWDFPVQTGNSGVWERRRRTFLNEGPLGLVPLRATSLWNLGEPGSCPGGDQRKCARASTGKPGTTMAAKLWDRESYTHGVAGSTKALINTCYQGCCKWEKPSVSSIHAPRPTRRRTRGKQISQTWLRQGSRLFGAAHRNRSGRSLRAISGNSRKYEALTEAGCST